MQKSDEDTLVGKSDLSLGQLSKIISSAVETGCAPLRDELDTLKKAQAEWKFCGAWEEGRVYAQNNHVVHDGSCWIALQANAARPGQGDRWQLISKRGRDGIKESRR